MDLNESILQRVMVRLEQTEIKEMEEDEDRERNAESEAKKKKVVITIPSYQEVIESSQSKSTPPSLFAPSQTFSQAFAFVKSSEFYSPPPTSTTIPSQTPHVSETTAARYPCFLVVYFNSNPHVGVCAIFICMLTSACFLGKL